MPRASQSLCHQSRLEDQDCILPRLTVCMAMAAQPLSSRPAEAQLDTAAMTRKSNESVHLTKSTLRDTWERSSWRFWCVFLFFFSSSLTLLGRLFPKSQNPDSLQTSEPKSNTKPEWKQSYQKNLSLYHFWQNDVCGYLLWCAYIHCGNQSTHKHTHTYYCG